jgi:hypothetical protein
MKKLAIVGSGSNTRDNAPFDDPSFDIWVFNEAANRDWCKRFDAVFQMHEPEIYKGHNTKDPEHWQWLQRKHFKPVYMQEVDPLVPDSVRFPIEDALELTGFDYFSATFAYMAALAVLLEYEQVDIHGIEMSHSEYQYQAECWRFWIGFMKGRMKVNLHSGEHLFTSPRYGYDGNFVFGVEYFEERARILDAEWTASEKNARNVHKAIERVIDKNEVGKLPDLIRDYQKAIQTTGEFAGALAEAERYQTFGNRYADRGGFELAAATAQRDGEEKRVLMFSKIGLIEYLADAWQGSREQPEFNKRARAQLLAHLNHYGKLSEETGALLGKYRENIAYIVKYDNMVQAHGGIRIAPLKMEMQTA